MRRGPKVIVVGCGVSGLSCAIRLREAQYDTEIWTRDLPADTTSHVAAAIWHPYRAYPEQLVAEWSVAGYQRFVDYAHQTESGVIVRQGVELFDRAVADPWWKAAVPDFRRALSSELPEGFVDGYCYSAPIIEMPLYLSFLWQRFASLGGVVHQVRVHRLDDALAKAPVVINCVGLAARTVVPDRLVFPIRGQIIRVERGDIDRFLLDGAHGPAGPTYIIPRLNDCILGGTADERVESLEPNPATAETILARCTRLEPRLKDARILSHRVGLRPGRSIVRVEGEPRPGGKLIVHNYGHGGAGVTVSWGCAEEVLKLLKRRLEN